MQSRREGYDRIDELLAGFTIQKKKKRTTVESLSVLFVLLRDIHSDNVGTAVVSGKEKKALYTLPANYPGNLDRQRFLARLSTQMPCAIRTLRNESKMT